MKIRCTNCNAAYAVDDSKVEGKKFGFECPKCGANVVIDNRPAAASSPVKEEPSLAPMPAALESSLPEMPDFAAAGDELPSFDEMPSAPEPAEDAIGSLPSFDDELTAELPSSASSGSGESVNYDDFEDEIEPEIDLSVLQGLSVSAPAAAADEDVLSADFGAPLVEEDLSIGVGEEVETISEPSETSSAEDDEDESITIDLDSLDIDLAEPEEVGASGAADSEFAPVAAMEGDLSAEVSAAPVFDENEDESITLDLDSLDIALEESDEIHPGENPEEDESRLSLGDAGLSLDDIEASEEGNEEDDENLHLSLDDVSEGFTMPDDFDDEIIVPEDTIEEEPISAFASAESSLDDSYTSNMLPEVDLDRYGAVASTDMEAAPAAPVEDQFLDIESQKGYQKYEGEIGAYSAEKVAGSGGGFINFSVDYAFHYSRVRSLLRLIGVYFITFIPHLIVYGIYSVIAGVTGAINWLMILFSGEREKDFSLLQEQSLRYGLSIFASLLNVVEEKPSFGGKKNIDYQMQFNVVYPPRYSRVLAFLRLTGVGILVLALPHLILFIVLSIGMLLICFLSLLFTIVAGHWPSLTFDFMVRYLRYSANIAGFVYGLVDTYPSFRFE